MIMSQQLVVLLAVIVVMAALALFFKRTRAGKWMQATASNPKAAMLCGLRIDRIYMYTFAVGAAVAGAAGVLMAPLTHLYPDVGFVLFIKGMAAAVLGGLTSIPGAVLGGVLLGLAEQLAAGYLHSSIQDVVAFLVIMFALIFLPTGLLGCAGCGRSEMSLRVLVGNRASWRFFGALLVLPAFPTSTRCSSATSCCSTSFWHWG